MVSLKQICSFSFKTECPPSIAPSKSSQLNYIGNPRSSDRKPVSQVDQVVARVESRKTMLSSLSDLGFISSEAANQSQLALDAVEPEVWAD